ncbi:helix-hairpin-helix domain-containing protein [Streptococcus castoreus]|uniref:helix-hairpin-helix domain-containing protein n=1 Tax=Streptococcus castoreus TaxID=254786 RepID=UPI0003FADE8B|nr:helix-hairpin-helix domain-containing protein [Streptococcus castoreus]
MIEEFLNKGRTIFREYYSLPRFISLLLCFCMLLGFSLFFLTNKRSKPETISLSDISQTKRKDSYEKTTYSNSKTKQEDRLLVDLKGAVRKEGVYQLSPNSRVGDLIEMAGGLTEEADRHAINLAEKLVDEQVVYVAKQGEDMSVITSAKMKGTSVTAERSKLNLNKASLEDLQKISGIGSKRAQDIITVRNRLGGFKRLEDLCQVTGIGEKILEKLKNEISVD